MSVVPLPAEVPPHETVYHCHVAAVPNDPPDSVSVIAVPGHTVREGFPVTKVAAEEVEFIVTVTV